MDIEYEAVGDPRGRAWRLHATVLVYGYAEGWVVFARVVPGQRFAIAELRIFPADGPTLPDRDGFVGRPLPSEENARGEWSHRTEFVPSGGVPTDLLRAVREGEIKAAAREWLVSHTLEVGGSDPVWRRVAEQVVRGAEFDARKAMSTDQRLALIAAEYVELLDDPESERRPNAVLAERHGRTPAWATSEVYRARGRGLLEPAKPGHGRRQGWLTDKAKQVLHELTEEREANP